MHRIDVVAEVGGVPPTAKKVLKALASAPETVAFYRTSLHETSDDCSYLFWGDTSLHTVLQIGGPDPQGEHTWFARRDGRKLM